MVIPEHLLARAATPSVHRCARAACCQIWPYWIPLFVLAAWAVARNGPDNKHLMPTIFSLWRTRIGADRGTIESLLEAEEAPKPSLLVALAQRLLMKRRPPRVPNMLEMLPKSRHTIWQLSQLANQIALLNSSTASGQAAPPASSFSNTSSSPTDHHHQQHHQDSLEVLQQKAAALLAKPHPGGPQVLTTEFLEQLRGALEAWENRESFLQRMRGVCTFGTIIWSMGIAGILATLLPVIVAIKLEVILFVCWVAPLIGSLLELFLRSLFMNPVAKALYRAVPALWTLARDIYYHPCVQDAAAKLVTGLLRLHYSILMPCYPGLGFGACAWIIAASTLKSGAAGAMLVMTGLAPATLGLVIMLRRLRLWSWWLNIWELMQPVLHEVPPEHAHLLENAHNRGRVDFDRVCRGYLEKDWNGKYRDRVSNCPITYLHDHMRDIMEKAAPFYLARSLGPLFLGRPVRSARLYGSLSGDTDGPSWLYAVLSCTVWVMVAAPFARLHSSQLLGFTAVGALFWCILVIYVAIEDNNGGTACKNVMIDAFSYGSMFTASPLVLSISVVGRLLGVDAVLSPFVLGFNVFGCLSWLLLGLVFSTKGGCKKWAKDRGLNHEQVWITANVTYGIALLVFVLLAATWEFFYSSFATGCIFLGLFCIKILFQFSKPSRSGAGMMMSILLCVAGLYVHKYPEIWARVLGLK